MAWRWRIRHKLMIGLGLVAGIIGLILAGTVYGLVKFRGTMKGVDNKVAEMSEAYQLSDALIQLESAIKDQAFDNPKSLQAKFADVRTHLEEYDKRLQHTRQEGWNPNSDLYEGPIVKVLRDKLDHLEKTVNQKRSAASVVPNAASPELLRDSDIGSDVQGLKQDTRDLQGQIYEAFSDRSKDARQNFQLTLWIVCSTGVGGVLILAALLRFYYGWMFEPIQALEAGAGRLARGEFDHRIDVTSGDELEGLARAFNDMTQRLREMYRDLEHQVNERSRQLVRSERLAGVGFLAAGVAHEINNPLASIAFCSEAMEDRLKGLLSGTTEESAVIQRYLRMIQQEAFRCKAITQRLLEFSRGGERHREPTDLVELTQGVLEMVQHLQNCRGKRIVFDPPDRLIAWVNGPEIKSVVLNLIVNALDSMDDGGTLTIRLATRDRMAEMTFADTGCGMTPEVLENIFEPFFTRSHTGKGTGLGLSICHRVINQHQGEIEATSPGTNRGSTFTVRLPLEPAEPVKEEWIGQRAA